MSWTFGIKRLLSGPIASDGGMGTALTENGETLKGTASLETTEPTINWIETEEKGKRKSISQNDSEIKLSFEVANPTLEQQVYYLGGSVTTVATKKRYAPPRNGASIEKTFKVETLEGFDIEIPHGKVTATPLGGNIGTENVLTLKVIVTAQVPTKAGVEAIYYVEK